MFGSKLLIKLRIDDAVDAIPVHLFGGVWGLIATGLFSAPDLMEQAYGQSDHVGWFYEWNRGSGNFTLLGIQLIGVLFIAGWTVTLMYPFFYILNFFASLRVDPLEEEAGMDISRHRGPGYNVDTSGNESAAVENLRTSRSLNSSGTKKKDTEVPESAKEVEA